MTYFWEIDAESIHVHAVEKPSEALREARQAFVHQLQLHEVLFEIGHGIAELSEPVLQALERIGRGCCATTALHTVPQ